MRYRTRRPQPIAYSPVSLRSVIRERAIGGSKKTSKVVTLVEAAMRPCITQATRGYCSVVHADSIAQAVTVARDRDVTALLVSPSTIADGGMTTLANMVSRSSVLTVAVIAEQRHELNRRLLELGQCGVRHAVDISRQQGWNELRGIVASSDDQTTRQILDAIMPALFDSTASMRRFIDVTVRTAGCVTTVRALARGLQVHPSSLMSRFFRARLPAPKRYLTEVRLMYAASYFENRLVSVAKVADRLDYSSPQSFGRTIRTVTGLTATGFRYRYTLEAMINRFVETLIAPYAATLQTFDPLGLDRNRKVQRDGAAV